MTDGLALPALPDPDADPQFYAGVPAKRLLAFVLDVIAVWGVAILVSILTLGLGFFLFAALVGLIDLFYRVLTIASRSATPGMRVVGIELRDAAGQPLTFGQALVHTLLFYIAMAFVIAQLVSVLLMAGSRFGRGLHDIPLPTTMINRPL